jgi:asparagine synthase (glutamine-hydrolysing)
VGAFFLLRTTAAADLKCKRETVAAALSEQGFNNPKIIHAADYDLYLYSKIVVKGTNIVKFDDGGFCACTGTFLYKGRIGEGALRQYYVDLDTDHVSLTDTYGAFCLIVRKYSRTFMLIDRLGIYKIYHDSSNTLFSSSFLAVASGLNSVRIDSQSVYEYIFQGTTYGNKTIFREIELLNSELLYEFDITVKTERLPDCLVDIKVDDRTAQNTTFLLERNLETLRNYFKIIVENFGSQVDTALSGGYDSRLTLALLLEQGCRPDIHVYGRDEDADVKIARLIDQGENFGLVHMDKGKAPKLALMDFSSVIEKNYHAFDGYVADGIFNNGLDLATRQERCLDGNLMLNGGGGEIFRNFFYLSDKPFNIRQLIWTFYSQYDPQVCTERFIESDYLDRLAQKLRGILHTDADVLSRKEIELLYPLFRCRFWMGRNNSINNRFGYALTPFIDYEVVKCASTIPMAEKNFGRFEARLIRAVSPTLAAYTSAYGHDFASSPSLRRIAGDLATLMRPPGLRRYSYRIQHRRRQRQFPYFLTAEYQEQVLVPGYPYLSRYVEVDAMRDGAQVNRVYTLEYLFARFTPQDDC